jgi:hypothetical protein
MSSSASGPTAPKSANEKTRRSEDAKDVDVTYASASSDLSGSDDEDDINPNPFSSPEKIAHWKLVYENAQYECRHVFDPALTWTEEEEKAIVRKLDWRVCTWAV